MTLLVEQWTCIIDICNAIFYAEMFEWAYNSLSDWKLAIWIPMDFSYTAVFNDGGFWLIKHCVSGETMVVVRGEVAKRWVPHGHHLFAITWRHSHGPVFRSSDTVIHWSFTHYSPAHNESSLALKTLYIVLCHHDSSLCIGRANVKRCTYFRISKSKSHLLCHFDQFGRPRDPWQPCRNFGFGKTPKWPWQHVFFGR